MTLQPESSLNSTTTAGYSLEPSAATPAVIAAAVAGNACEFYDFVTYAFFAVYIGHAFFPSTSDWGSLLLSVAVFGAGFVTRPLGGVLIGAFADRHGRKPAMMLTMTLITVGTMGLALTPTYQQLGLAAPVIVVVSRLIQGFALGGEVGPASSFLIEAAPPHKRGLYGSWQIASQGAATLVAGLVGLALTRTLSPADLQAWGWRLPFALGFLILPVAFYLRQTMPETLHRKSIGTVGHGLARLKQYRRIIVLAVLVILGGTVSTYVGNYMTTYAQTTLHFAPFIAMGATVTAGMTTVLFAIAGGWLSDRVGRLPVMLIPRVLAAILTVPAFLFLHDHPSTATLFAITCLMAALTSLSTSASIVAIPELLPNDIRASGLSIAYAVGVALFGGTTQFVVTWLIGYTGNPIAPAWYVTLTSVITLLAMLALPKTAASTFEM